MRSLYVLSILALGCGSVQPSITSEVLSDGFPAKLHPAQQRPGKDGKGHIPGGWNQDMPYQGRCWYPLPGNTQEGEPMVSAEPVSKVRRRRCSGR
jgi:hypothetical protein